MPENDVVVAVYKDHQSAEEVNVHPGNTLEPAGSAA
jgi:hypothetical protein